MKQPNFYLIVFRKDGSAEIQPHTILDYVINYAQELLEKNNSVVRTMVITTGIRPIILIDLNRNLIDINNR